MDVPCEAVACTLEQTADVSHDHRSVSDTAPSVRQVGAPGARASDAANYIEIRGLSSPCSGVAKEYLDG